MKESSRVTAVPLAVDIVTTKVEVETEFRKIDLSTSAVCDIDGDTNRHKSKILTIYLCIA
jgi:hypothetical protein